MSPTLSTFLFELTNFLLLAGLLGWLLFKPVRNALQERQASENARSTRWRSRRRRRIGCGSTSHNVTVRSSGRWRTCVRNTWPLWSRRPP